MNTPRPFKHIPHSLLDYYPFGSIVECRSWKGDYRYGFNGQEEDDEVSGSGNSYTAEYWQYDARLGRRWNVDPVVKGHQSPFTTLSNNPMVLVDPLGALDYFNKRGKKIGTDGVNDGQLAMALERSTRRVIKKASRKGLNISLNLYEHRDVIFLLKEEEISAAEAAYQKSKSGNENGYAVAESPNGPPKVIHAEEGTPTDIDLWPAREEASKIQGYQISYDAHVHTDRYKILEDGRININKPEASGDIKGTEGDIPIRIKSENTYPNGYNKPSLILGYETEANKTPEGKVSVKQFEFVTPYDARGNRRGVNFDYLKKVSRKATRNSEQN